MKVKYTGNGLFSRGKAFLKGKGPYTLSTRDGEYLLKNFPNDFVLMDAGEAEAKAKKAAEAKAKKEEAKAKKAEAKG